MSKVGEDFDFSPCYGDLRQEFRVIKKSYCKKALKTHPDKGGGSFGFFFFSKAYSKASTTNYQLK